MPKAILQRHLELAAQARPAPPIGKESIKQIRAFRSVEPVSGRAYTVLRIETAAGLSGHGECGPISHEQFRQLNERLGTGIPATAVETVRRLLGDMPAAQAAVNMALLDIAGKAAQVPTYQLLGGPTRSKARAMATLESGTNDELKRSLERALAAGFRAATVPLPAKSELNPRQAFVESVRKRLRALRESGGPHVDFMLSGNASLTPAEAADIAVAVEEFRVLWFDEPCPRSNLATLSKISDESVTPLGFGQDITHAGEFQDLLREGVIDILRPDISLNGITQIRRMAALAETYYIAVAPHHNGGPVATAAALHLAASLPNFFIQQVPFPAAEADRKVREQLTGEPVETVRDGFFHLPQGPGLGIRIAKEGEQL